jgi:hypothetical protein
MHCGISMFVGKLTKTEKIPACAMVKAASGGSIVHALLVVSAASWRCFE